MRILSATKEAGNNCFLLKTLFLAYSIIFYKNLNFE